ncbi:hypothetical protein ASZ78_009306 [Callipepla squamata]|uniref:Phosphatase and actin regulator n=1 Tax=Callipepla squamata TaxID=9009 RepID=A0A226MQM4_CALSU|nr:hypothetical protein ASZ78_009306 [Callipepla squamata]
MDHVGSADAEDDPGSRPRLAPSPHSEAVAHEFKELSLQPTQCLPPLNERKNGFELQVGNKGIRILTMIDSCKKQQQGFSEILPAGDVKPLKEKECLEVNSQKSLKEALKSPAAFHEQIKSLERARTENFLKHKIRSRPDRSELVRMHILEGLYSCRGKELLLHTAV